MSDLQLIKDRWIIRLGIMIAAACAAVVIAIAIAVFDGDPIQGWDILLLFIVSLVGGCIIGYDALQRQRRINRRRIEQLRIKPN